jgi:hypothetical protein
MHLRTSSSATWSKKGDKLNLTKRSEFIVQWKIKRTSSCTGALIRNNPQHVNHVMTLQEKQEDFLNSSTCFFGCSCSHIIESLLRGLGATVRNYSTWVPSWAALLSTLTVESERITSSSGLPLIEYRFNKVLLSQYVAFSRFIFVQHR